MSYEEKEAVKFAIKCRIETLECFVKHNPITYTVREENQLNDAKKELENLKSAQKKL